MSKTRDADGLENVGLSYYRIAGKEYWWSTGLDEMSKTSDAARMLNVVGRSLYPGRQDWKAQLAFDLDVAPTSVKQWENGHLDFDASHGALDDMIKLCERRAINAVMAKQYLISFKRSGK